MSAPLVFIRAGTVDYLQAWERQQHLHARRVDDRAPDTVLLLEHLPIYTAGKRTEDYERPTDETPVVDVDRGGRITWHGPGQLVGYPIIALAKPLDVVAYVRRLEEGLIKVCADLGVAAGQTPGRSGVWIRAEDGGPDRKLAAIGVRVSRGVTMHGFAINCNPDLSAYDRIIACGISDASVTSLTKELGRDVTVDEILPSVESRLEEALSAELARAA